ncbi:MAG: TonB-dependent receptor [Gammaproteobacteria bacterium]|nr:TonB-dependent receptor [Gammaproteobacteria bacterium]
MSIEIRRVVREILAPMVAVVPCMALMAAAPRIAVAQSDDQSSSDQSPTQLKKITIVAQEEAVATINPLKFTHISPATTVVSVLQSVPGFNSQAIGPGGLLVADNLFTLDGFTSTQVGTTYDGVPIVNTFLGGVYGAGDAPFVTPMDMSQVSGVEVYSGANVPSKTSVDSLGGTIAYEPALPTPNFDVELSATGGLYQGGGTQRRYGVAVNSGALQGWGGLDVLAKISQNKFNGFWDNVSGQINSYYLAVAQPTSSGEVTLVALENDDTSPNIPNGYVPQPLATSFRYDYPLNVGFKNQASHATHVILTAKSLLNPRTIGVLKAFYSGTTNDRTAWANPIYSTANNPGGSYNGYSYDLPVTFKSCNALNGYVFNGDPDTYPNVYNCAAATAAFGSPAAGTAYQHYVNNYANAGAKGDLTFLFPGNTVEVGSMYYLAKALSAESWYGSYPSPVIDGYNMAWMEHDDQTYFNAYVQDSIALFGHKLHIYPGVKWNHLAETANDNQGYFYRYSGSVTQTYSWIEPSIGVNFAFAPDWNAYVNFGKSSKAPNISALYGVISSQSPPLGQIPGPVSVQPEYVANVDAGIRFNNGYYKWDASIFNRRFTNIFSSNYNDVTGITVTYNSGSADFKGVNLDGEVALPYHLQLEANANYTSAKYTSSFTNSNGAAVTSGQWRPEIPVVSGNVFLNFSNGPWYASLSGHYTGSEYMQDYNTGVTTPYQLGGFALVNFDAAYTLTMNADVLQSLKFELNVDNLLNRHAIYSSQVAENVTPNYNWVAFEPPLFAGLTVTADLF